MIQTNFSTPLDQNAERKRALAEIYGLLLQFVEEAEQESVVADIRIVEEKATDVSQNQADSSSGVIPTSNDLK